MKKSTKPDQGRGLGKRGQAYTTKAKNQATTELKGK